MKWTFMFPLLALLFVGCASAYLPLTDSYRSSADLSKTVFHPSSQITLRSVRPLLPVDTTTIFRSDGHRYLVVAESDPGRLRAQNPAWLIIEFSQDIMLRFERSEGGEYLMPGWGTITVGDERYDLQLGMLSSTKIRLLIEPPRPL